MQNEDNVMAAIDRAFGKKEDRFRKLKTFLFQVKDRRRTVEMLETRIGYRMDSMGARGVTYDEYIPSTHDYSGSSVESIVLEISELEEKLAAAERAYADAKVAVSDLIATLDDVNQQSVVTRKYVDGQSWEKIACDMDMSVRKVQRLHGRALPLLQEILDAGAAA